MSLFPREVPILLRKEWRQILRSPNAVATSLLLPLLLLIGAPLLVRFAGTASGSVPIPKGTLPTFLPGLLELSGDLQHALPRFLMPFMVGLTGVVVPSVAGAYTLVAERESRTIELLVALPVRIGQVLVAKLCAILLLACAVTMPLLLLSTLVMVSAGTFTWSFGFALLAELLGALAYSTSSALLVSLLARDYRAAQNVLGALLTPSILVVPLVLIAAPGGLAKIVALGLLYAAVAAILGAISVRVVTFERLLR